MKTSTAKNKPTDRPIYEYRDGAEGFISWCEDKVHLPIYPEGSDIPVWTAVKDLPREPHPETGRSYWEMWEEQKEIMRNALKMKNSRFIYRLIVFCWPRGEGKSVIACLVQMWKFFCWPRQNIVLGANSKDQVKFVHFDIIRDIILNSPRLLAEVGGKKNIREKEIRMKDARGNTVSTIKAISSFSGIVSNITGYTFSEMFAMKNPKFFVQLDGSIRNIPNAFGCIDSTVSDKKHVLYKMHMDKQRKEKGTENLYYSYRYSKDGKQEDYWNPNMTQDQLDGYKVKFPFGEFERYFKNTWGAGTSKVFTDEMVEAIHILGMKDGIGNHQRVVDLLEEKRKILDFIELTRTEETEKREEWSLEFAKLDKLDAIAKSFTYIDDVYHLADEMGTYRMASIQDLIRVGDIFDTNWSVLAGIDRADPLKQNVKPTKTSVSILAKGLPGSRSNPFAAYKEGFVPAYLYILLHVGIVKDHSLEGIKKELSDAHEEFNGLDSICGERWGLWDLAPWCEEKEIYFEAIFPTYDKQKSAFGELYGAVSHGLFKSPVVLIRGMKEDSVLDEEMKIFDHDADKKWFGSPEKDEKYGIQDDVMYSIGWGAYGGREKGVGDFRERGKISGLFGYFFKDRELHGSY